ncbi:hypothetical protein [Streptomyces cyaneofuscatus]
MEGIRHMGVVQKRAGAQCEGFPAGSHIVIVVDIRCTPTVSGGTMPV